MVSHFGRATDSRARLLDAAASEFAAKGFDGAKVDRIAARARVNKAMLYYHFPNKAALYREILLDVFGAVADAVEPATASAGLAPEDQLRAFVAAIASSAVTRPCFPPIWLREIAEGGRRLDEPVIAEMHRVMQALVGVLQAGRRAGRFRDVHPLLVQLAIVGPLLLFAASPPVRKRLSRRAPHAGGELTRDTVIEFVQDATLAALAVRSPRAAGSSPRRRRRLEL